MNISKIKQLVKSNGDKFIFVENGEPELVVMSFGEYEKLANHNADDANNYANTANDTDRHSYSYHLDGRAEEQSHGAFELSSVGGLPETRVDLVSDVGSSGLPARLEDIRLEDLPI